MGEYGVPKCGDEHGIHGFEEHGVPGCGEHGVPDEVCTEYQASIAALNMLAFRRYVYDRCTAEIGREPRKMSAGEHVKHRVKKKKKGEHGTLEDCFILFYFILLL